MEPVSLRRVEQVNYHSSLLVRRQTKPGRSDSPDPNGNGANAIRFRRIFSVFAAAWIRGLQERGQRDQTLRKWVWRTTPLGRAIGLCESKGVCAFSIESLRSSSLAIFFTLPR